MDSINVNEKDLSDEEKICESVPKLFPDETSQIIFSSSENKDKISEKESFCNSEESSSHTLDLETENTKDINQSNNFDAYQETQKLESVVEQELLKNSPKIESFPVEKKNLAKDDEREKKKEKILEIKKSEQEVQLEEQNKKKEAEQIEKKQLDGNGVGESDYDSSNNSNSCRPETVNDIKYVDVVVDNKTNNHENHNEQKYDNNNGSSNRTQKNGGCECELLRAKLGELSEINANWKRKFDSAQKQTHNHIQTQHAQLLREKESMVLKYAKSEQCVIETQRRVRELENRLREASHQLGVARSETATAQKALQNRCVDAAQSETECVELRNKLKAAEARIQSETRERDEENKVARASRAKLDDMTKNLAKSKEETEMLRANCQQIVRQYQESDEIRSNSLESQLAKCVEELKREKTAHEALIDAQKTKTAELNSCKRLCSASQRECQNLLDKLQHYEAERLIGEEATKRLQASLTAAQSENRQLSKQLETALSSGGQEKEAMQCELEKLRASLVEAGEKAERSDERLGELEIESVAQRQREAELLEFTRQLSDRNANLQAELHFVERRTVNTTNNNNNNDDGEDDAIKKRQEKREKEKREESSAEREQSRDEKVYEKLRENSTKCESENVRNEEQLNLEAKQLQTRQQQQQQQREYENVREERRQRNEEVMSLRAELAELRGVEKSLRAELTVSKSEVRTIRRSQQAVIRDLPRQLDKLRGANESQANQNDHPIATQLQKQQEGASLEVTEFGGRKRAEESEQEGEGGGVGEWDAQPDVQLIQPNCQILIEKILKLTKSNARLAEKLDFLNEHNIHLMKEIRKKNNLLQNCCLRHSKTHTHTRSHPAETPNTSIPPK